MPTPVQLTLKDKNSGKALAKVEEPTTLKVVVLDLIDDLLAKVYTEKGNQSYTGYITKEEYDELNVSSVTIPESFAGLEAVAVPTRLKEQLFRIYSVEENEDYVTVRARHVWYDNLQNYTLWKPTEETQYTGAAVCRNILTNAISPVDSNVASDCTDEKPGTEFDYERKNLVECFLDPENGVCAKFGLSLIRDNWDFYCLKDVGYDRGYVIQTGKNLLGVVRDESIENVATRVCPIGMDAKGDIVWLNNDGNKYLDSQYINDYSFPRVEIFDTGLQVGQDDVTADNINAKLLEAAQKRFSEDKVDIPEVTMTVDFLSIGDTEEYAQYRGLDKVYLYDIVTIKDTVRGYEYSAQVVGVEHDILTGMLTSITLGKIENSDGVRKIAVWQVPEVNGENIRLKTIMAGSFVPGAIQADDIANGSIAYVHFASATIDYLETDTVNAVTANIHEIIAGSITAEDITAGSITSDCIATRTLQADRIAFGVITGDEIHSLTIDTQHLKADSITSDKIGANQIKTINLEANSITSDKIAAGQITSAKIGAGEIKAINIDSSAVTADKIDAGAINASKIDTTDLAAINATLGTASIASAQIANADISYAKVKDLTAGTAIFDTSITQQGIANKLFINRLLITYGQMVEATIGDLVIGASDGNYYHVDVSWDANGVPTLVPVQVTTPTAEEIAAGHTNSGKTIIGDVGTYAELSSSDFYAINSIIDVITAKRIDVDELWAREAFIDKLMVTDISSNTYIRSTIGDWQSGSTITQTVDGLNTRISELGYGTVFMQPDEPSHSELVSGDIWIQTLPNATWNDVLSQYATWTAVRNSASTWQIVGGIPKMKVWDGLHWVELYDSLLPTTVYTEIQQLSDEISLRATTAQVNQLGEEVVQFQAELTIQSQEIQAAVSAVDTKGSTYVMWADPHTAYSVSLGDTWVKRDPGFEGTWQNVRSSFATWNALKTTHDRWMDSLGDRTFVWDGEKWIETSDHAKDIYQQTQITQTSRDITLLAESTATLNDEYIQLSASVQVANDHITSEVQRATLKEGELNGSISRISQTANDIILGVQPVGSLSTYGSYIQIQNDSITLASGGKIIANANQIQIGSGETLQSALSKKGDVSSSIQQFYLSTSNTVLSGGSWSDTAPQWVDKKYMWMRTKVTHADGTVTYMPSSNGVCIAGAKGDKGQDGEGRKGDTGDPGISITGVTEYYLIYASNSGVTRSTSGWSTAVQTPTSAKPYLWNYEKITYSSGDPTYTSPVVIGNYAKDGVSISSVTEYYLASTASSGVTRETLGWTTTIQNPSSAKPYLWNYETVQYSNNTSTSTDPVIIGKWSSNGRNGQNIGAVITKYYLHTSFTVEPTATWDEWYDTMPTYEADKYYWTWTKTYLEDLTTEVSPPGVKLSELGVNAAYDQAADAAELANGIINGTQNAFYASNISNTGVTIDDTTLHVTASGNMYIDSGGALVIRSSASTQQSPQNVVVMNNSGIAIESTGTISCAADKLILSSSGGTTVTLDSQISSIKLQASGNLAPEFSESKAYVIGDIVAHFGYLWRFRGNKVAGAWNVNFVERINVDDTYYDIKSGVDIKPEGIEISGGKYIKIKSGGTNKMTLDASGIVMDTSGKFVLTAKNGDNSSILFGQDAANATFSVGDSGNVKCNDLTVMGNLSVMGNSFPKVVVSRDEPSGNNIMWLQPGSTSARNLNFRPSPLTFNNQGAGTLGYYMDYTVPYSADYFFSGATLYYGILAKLQFYNMTGYAIHKFKASILVGETYEQIAYVEQNVGQWATITLDTSGVSKTNVFNNDEGGSITLRLESTASGAIAMLLNEDITLRLKDSSTDNFSVCTVRYKQ